MRTSDAVTLALVALCATVPAAFVVVVALVRGYTIQINMRRPRRGREGTRRDRRGGD